MNELALFQKTAVGSLDALDQKMKAGQSSLPQVSGGVAILRIGAQDGKWVFGQENIPVEEGSKWAVNPFSFQTGWVCWADPKVNRKNEKLGEVMGPPDAAPACPALTPEQQAKGGEWQEQIGFRLVCISGEDEGEEVLYQNSSYGAMKAYREVYDAVMNRPSKPHCFPIVVITSDSYQNKTYNRTVYNPVFEVVDWADLENNLLSGGKPAAVAGPEETSDADSQAADPEPAPEAATSEPSTEGRRRRRRTA